MGWGGKESSPGVILLSKQAVTAAPSPPVSRRGRARERPRACHGRVASVIRPRHQSLGTRGRALPSPSLGHPSEPVTGNESGRSPAKEDASPTSSTDEHPG